MSSVASCHFRLPEPGLRLGPVDSALSPYNVKPGTGTTVLVATLFVVFGGELATHSVGNETLLQKFGALPDDGELHGTAPWTIHVLGRDPRLRCSGQRDCDARAHWRFRGGLSHHVGDFERRISLGFTLITCVSPQLPFALTLRNADRHEADRASDQL